jgi:hypothetical protein
MARVSIYVPDELKARMDEAGEAINWSEVARPAFQNALANYRHRKEINMTTAIERLRASKAKVLADQSEEGKAEGSKWARDAAEFDELQRVAEIDTDGFTEDWCSVLLDTIDPRGEQDRYELLDGIFLEGRRGISDERARGFIEGAQEVWEEVKDEI